MSDTLMTANPTEGTQETPTGVEGQQQATEQAQQVAEPTAAESKPQGAPEKYEFSAPEGTAYNENVVTAFSEAARELDLNQESAQKILEKIAPALHDRQMQQIEETQNGWAQASKSDAEFGGDKLNENLAVAKKAIDKFGTPELSQLLNDSKLGNHPEIIRLMVRVGKLISEDTFVGSTQGAGAKTDKPKDFAGYANTLYNS